MSTPNRVVFLSGKGGAGKTSIAISLAKFLALLGKKCLLVDFDLATNGASYFFKDQISGTKGIWEFMNDCENSDSRMMSPLKLREGFHFMASRVSFSIKGPAYDSVPYTKASLLKRILEPLYDWAKSNSVDYFVIDCQAGYSISSVAAASFSDRAIFVAEPDSVSNDAVDNVMVQIGSDLPETRRYLINKIDVRDADTYRNMRNVFQTLNRLPPIPFDFSVRNAFGSRRIPLQENEASSFLFAMIETTKVMLEELYDDIEKYKRSHVDEVFERYTKSISVLAESKNDMIEKLAKAEARVARKRFTLISVLLLLPVTATVGFTFFAKADFAKDILSATTPLFGLIAAVTGYLMGKQGPEFTENSEEVIKIRKALTDLEREMDQSRSLIFARSRELLIDSEITRPKPTAPEGAPRI